MTPEQRQKVERALERLANAASWAPADRRADSADVDTIREVVEELDQRLQEREQRIKQHADALTRWLGGGRILARWLVNMPTVEDLGRAKESLRAIELPGAADCLCANPCRSLISLEHPYRRRGDREVAGGAGSGNRTPASRRTPQPRTPGCPPAKTFPGRNGVPPPGTARESKRGHRTARRHQSGRCSFRESDSG